jgi:hypothetical protein
MLLYANLLLNKNPLVHSRDERNSRGTTLISRALSLYTISLICISAIFIRGHLFTGIPIGYNDEISLANRKNYALTPTDYSSPS